MKDNKYTKDQKSQKIRSNVFKKKKHKKYFKKHVIVKQKNKNIEPILKATGGKIGKHCIQRNKELSHTSHQKLCKSEDNGGHLKST